MGASEFYDATHGDVFIHITYRKWKAIDITSVQSDISGSFIDFSPHDLSSAIKFYNDTLEDIVEKHAPKKSRVVTVRANKSWYTAELSAAKRSRCKCERKYKNTQLESDKLLLKEQRNKFNNLCNSTKKDYNKNKIENAQSSKDLYKIYNKLLNREQRSVLPAHDCATSLANTFVDYFKNKIEQPWRIFEYIYWSVTIHCPHSSWIITWTVDSCFWIWCQKSNYILPYKIMCSWPSWPHAVIKAVSRPGGPCSHCDC